MTDLQTNPTTISAPSEGGSSTAGRATTKTVAPAVAPDPAETWTLDGGMVARNNQRGRNDDSNEPASLRAATASESDDAGAAEDSGGDAGWSEPEDELTTLKKQVSEYDKRLKGFQAAMQREVEQRRQIEQQFQRQQAQQAQQLPMTQEEAGLVREYHQFEAASQYMTPDDASAWYQSLQQRAALVGANRQLQQRELQLRQREAALTPMTRANDIKSIESEWQKRAGVGIPTESISQHATNSREARGFAYYYALGQRDASNGVRRASLEAEAGNASPPSAARSGSAKPVTSRLTGTALVDWAYARSKPK